MRQKPARNWWKQVLPLFTGNTSMVVTVKPMHALKMKHVLKALVYGMCLAVINGPGIT